MKIVGTVSLDFSTAFDFINHKLKCYDFDQFFSVWELIDKQDTSLFL